MPVCELGSLSEYPYGLWLPFLETYVIYIIVTGDMDLYLRVISLSPSWIFAKATRPYTHLEGISF